MRRRGLLEVVAKSVVALARFFCRPSIAESGEMAVSEASTLRLRADGFVVGGCGTSGSTCRFGGGCWSLSFEAAILAAEERVTLDDICKLGFTKLQEESWLRRTEES